MVLRLLRRLSDASRLVAAALAFTAASGVGSIAADEAGPAAAVDAPSATTPSTEIRKEHDVDLGTAVSQALADDRRVQALNMKIAVRNGVVTLTGRANDADEKRVAEEVARRVAAVRDVENQLVVAEPGAPAPGASVIPEVPSQPPAR